MIARVTLPTLAVLAVAGVGGGMYLGKAAVSEINPIYYDQPGARFHGDLVPYRPTEVAGYQAGELSAANLDQAFGTGCVGCRAYPEEVVLVHRGTSGKAEVGYAEVTSEPVQAVAYEPESAVEFASVERYTSYPVAQEAASPVAEPPQVELAVAEAIEVEAAE